MGLGEPILDHFLPPSTPRIRDNSRGAPESLVSQVDQSWGPKDSDLFAAQDFCTSLPALTMKALNSFS